MNASLSLPRSPELLSRSASALLAIDLQARLMPAIAGNSRIVWNVGRLADGARALGVTVLATEQNPSKLGGTIPDLAERLGSPASKLRFSCGERGELFRGLQERGIYQVLLAGVETHVCVLQTALDLQADGFRVFLAVDATGSRSDLDRDVAFRRMEGAGVTLTTTESALFEWCEVAGTPEFRRISELAKLTPP